MIAVKIQEKGGEKTVERSICMTEKVEILLLLLKSCLGRDVSWLFERSQKKNMNLQKGEDKETNRVSRAPRFSKTFGGRDVRLPPERSLKE